MPNSLTIRLMISPLPWTRKVAAPPSPGHPRRGEGQHSGVLDGQRPGPVRGDRVAVAELGFEGVAGLRPGPRPLAYDDRG